ncbi:hypothetical protein C8J57DRAFT_1474304 [Mycena rebaudengoi]|nr:hypothetical protein C8J57DRAFT_1474304 [Mycena rebaudengoi]
MCITGGISFGWRGTGRRIKQPPRTVARGQIPLGIVTSTHQPPPSHRYERTPTHPEVYPAGFPQNDRQRPPCHSSEKNADRDAAGGSNKVGDRNEMGLGLGLGHDDGRTEGKELERPNGKRAPRVSRQGQAAMSRVEKEDETTNSREGSMGGWLHGSRKGIGKIWRSGKQRDPGTAQRAKGRREGDGWECDDREGSGKTKRKPRQPFKDASTGRSESSQARSSDVVPPWRHILPARGEGVSSTTADVLGWLMDGFLSFPPSIEILRVEEHAFLLGEPDFQLPVADQHQIIAVLSRLYMHLREVQFGSESLGSCWTRTGDSWAREVSGCREVVKVIAQHEFNI